MSDIAISASTNPYVGSTYKAESNDRNTLNISDYFQLLAAQLANQDMTDPMSNGEMMQQLVQMAMAESVTSMTETMETMQAVSTQTYAASLIGQEISVAVVEDGVATGIKYGKVASVNFTSADPMIRLEGDLDEYPLSYVLGMGKIDDPYNAGETTPETGEDETVNKVEGEEGTESGAEGTVENETVTETPEEIPQAGAEDGTNTEEAVTEPENSEENTAQETPVE